MIKKGIKARLACRGKIKIGGLGDERTSKNGVKYNPPEKYDHFLITTNERDSAGRLYPDKEIMEIYGDKPKELNVVLFSNNIEDVYDDFLAFYVGKNSCVCRGDGEVGTWDSNIQKVPDGVEVISRDKYGNVTVKCSTTCPCLSLEKQAKCKPNAILRVMVQEAQAVGAVYELRTTSYNSISSIRASLALLHKATGGYIAGVPLKMKVLPKETNTITGNAVKIYVVHLEYPGAITDLQKVSMETQKISIGYQNELLEFASYSEESPAEIEHVINEYYTEDPDAQEEKPKTPAKRSKKSAGKKKAQSSDKSSSKKEETPDDQAAQSQESSATSEPEKTDDQIPAENEAVEETVEAPEVSQEPVVVQTINAGMVKMVNVKKNNSGITEEQFQEMLKRYGATKIEEIPSDGINDFLGELAVYPKAA